MFFFRQFETLDPLSADVSASSFAYLPEIAHRARALLKSRSKDQIIAAAEKINEEIERYFLDAKDSEIMRLKDEISPDDEDFQSYFEWDGGSLKNGRWLFKEDMVDELGIATAENTSFVDALKAVIEDRDSYGFYEKVEPVTSEYPQGKDYELFAVLSLWLVADSIIFQEATSICSLSVSCEYAVKAMEAICYAEHLRDVEWLISNIKAQSQTELKDALLKQKTEHFERVKYFEKMKNERAQQQRRDRSKDLNKARHKASIEAAKKVTDEWEKNPHEFLSAEKAGIHYAAWLEKLRIGYTEKGESKSFQPRAVTGWIRQHAKKRDIRFR
jgi:hypothetical protein